MTERYVSRIIKVHGNARAHSEFRRSTLNPLVAAVRRGRISGRILTKGLR